MPNKCKQYASPAYCQKYKTFMKARCQKSCGFCSNEPAILRPGCKSKLGCCNDGSTPKSLTNECPVYKSICEMPKNEGTCFGYFLRYAFNPDSQKCEQFSYGGCDGNANNFMSLIECERRCTKPTTTAPLSLIHIWRCRRRLRCRSRWSPYH